MQQIPKFSFALLALLLLVFAPSAGAQPAEQRIALVIGNAGYQAGALATPANDAGLIAQTLQAAGFDVVGARDLDEDSLRHVFRDFVEKAANAGPNTVAVVYFAGYGLQLEGENYLLPVDANIARYSDVPVRGLRISDYMRAFATLHLKAAIVVLDAARAGPFSTAGEALAGGLALVEPDPGTLVAFNATPGTVAPEGQEGYGAYAKALAEMIREGGLQPADLFERVRLRVNEATSGAQVPWDASKIETPFVFFNRGPDAPQAAATAEQTLSIRSRPIRDLAAQDAYLAALSRDTVDAYEDFLAAYPRDPMAKRVRAIIAVRREAITWRRTYQADTPEAYWSYLKRYSRGPHAADARRRLAHLAVVFEPPPRFAMIEYDVAPPPPDEVVYVDRPVLVFDDPDFGFAPPPPPPVYFLAPPPPDFVVLEPPPPAYGAYILPVPVFVPIPTYVSAPAYVAPPPNPVIFNNIHNTVVVNNTTNVVTITNPSGQVVSSGPPPGALGVVGPTALAPALPPSVVPKATLINNQNPPPSAAVNPALPGTAILPPGRPLPGTKPLPPAAALPPPGGGSAHPPPPPAAALPPPGGGSAHPPPPPAAALPPPGGGSAHPPSSPAAALPPPAAGSSHPPSPPAAALPPPAAGSAHPPPPPAAALPPAAGSVHPPPPPAAALPPPAAGSVHPPPPPAAALPPPGGGSAHPPSSPAAALPPPAAGSAHPPSLPAAALPPPAAGSAHPPSPPAAALPPPGGGSAHPPPPPAAALPPPPPVAARPPSPPPAAVHPPPPPPVAAHPPPPPPPPVAARPPPPAAAHPPPPPAAAAAAARPPPAGKSCQVVNGQQVCK